VEAAVGSTWEAIRRAEQERNESAAAQSGALEQLTEDIAALRVTVHSLEDRLELELGGLSDDVRQVIAKADDLSAARGRAAEERLTNQLGWLTQATASGRRRLDAITALVAFTALLALFRC
jgi:chromosome segregation ATPase